MKVLSFVVPSYNSERFLDKCISSFLNPEVIDLIDIIIVNDGSTDGTAEKAQEYVDRYPQSIRLINQENKGHGGALNTGIAAANGKFFKVIDADDSVFTENLPQFTKKLCELDCDIVLSSYVTTNITTGEVITFSSPADTFGKRLGEEALTELFDGLDQMFTLHGIAYNTAFYKEKGISLSEKVFYEDHEFSSFPACFAKSIVPLDILIYNYRVGDVTQSVSEENQLKRISHVETVIRRHLSEYEKTEEAAARIYTENKLRILLMSYFVTVLLSDPKKAEGRSKAAEMVKELDKRCPAVSEALSSKLGILRIMNRLRVSRKTFEKLLDSTLYKKLTGRQN